jgi:hypothetical protein
MRKNLFIVLALVLLSSALVLAQSDPKAGYTEWQGENQTRNIPAGTVTDPGSHLTYIIDTGVDARAIAGVADLTTVAAAAKTPLQAGSLLADRLDTDGNGQLDEGAIYQSFIAITNTHPTMAVTVHFRYFNDNCEDLLDFLVVVTCNDTLMFDPLNFVIPYTNGENTRSRIVGPQMGTVLKPIPVIQWGSGRFLITAAASGATLGGSPTDPTQDDAEILFPYEFRSLDEECNIEADGTLAESNVLDDILAGNVQNVGERGGLVADNLHVFNAAQISFNFLIGHLTTAVPKGFITDPSASQTDQYLAYGVVAWARPSVNNNLDLNLSLIAGPRDGDGPQVPTGLILWGGDPGKTSDGTEILGWTNHFYLRNEVHGGDINAAPVGGYSLYGALGTTPFHPIPKRDNQLIHFLSVADDYNGSNNTAIGFLTVIDDNSANVSPAGTTYILQIYDNNEDLLTFTAPPIVPVSPPEISGTAVLKITCICLRVFLNYRDQATGYDLFNGSTSVDVQPIGKTAPQTGALELDDLEFFSAAVFDGLAPFDGLLKTSNLDSKGSVDLSGGWIRFVRDNTVVVGAPSGVPADAGTSVTGMICSGPGTATFDEYPTMADNDSFGPSFMTIGLFVLKFEGFGASWYLHAVASDAHISEIGAETY